MDLDIDPAKVEKIRDKLIDIAITRVAINQSPEIGIPEFKHIISSYKIKCKKWWKLAKNFEESDFLELRRNHIIVIHLKGVERLESRLRAALLYLNNSYIPPELHHKTPS